MAGSQACRGETPLLPSKTAGGGRRGVHVSITLCAGLVTRTVTDQHGRAGTGSHSPSTLHYSPLTTHYSLFTTHYSLFTTHHSPPQRKPGSALSRAAPRLGYCSLCLSGQFVAAGVGVGAGAGALSLSPAAGASLPARFSSAFCSLSLSGRNPSQPPPMAL